MNETEPETIKIPEIVQILAEKPEARRDLIRWIRKEFGFNAEPWLEKYFGEMPDKKIRIEEIDQPIKDVAESIFIMLDEGYTQGQIAYQLRLFPVQVKRIVDERDAWKDRIKQAARKKLKTTLPWYLRPFAWLIVR